MIAPNVYRLRKANKVVIIVAEIGYTLYNPWFLIVTFALAQEKKEKKMRN